MHRARNVVGPWAAKSNNRERGQKPPVGKVRCQSPRSDVIVIGEVTLKGSQLLSMELRDPLRFTQFARDRRAAPPVV